MKGVETIVPIKDTEGLDQIEWTMRDQHHADDPATDTVQYYSEWTIGRRGREIWQIKVSLPRGSSCLHYPASAYARIDLMRWDPTKNDDLDWGEWVWCVSINLTEEEVDLNRHGRLMVHAPGDNITSRAAPYWTIRDRAMKVYDSFRCEPYTILTRIAMGD
jgi:hypothetical protein